MKVLITGVAGFLELHTVQKFDLLGYEIIALDNINSYYETDLKYVRLNIKYIRKTKELLQSKLQVFFWKIAAVLKYDLVSKKST